MNLPRRTAGVRSAVLVCVVSRSHRLGGKFRRASSSQPKIALEATGPAIPDMTLISLALQQV